MSEQTTDTGISPKWRPAAKLWTGRSDGRHCHWCKHHVTDDGEVTCGHPDSKYNDGDRIRSWDGEKCAVNCEYFELDDWYKRDENYDTTFAKE